MVIKTAALLLLCLLPPVVAQEEPLCRATCRFRECIFHVNVALSEGQLGYFVFDECPELGPNPTLGMEYGVPYKFVQNEVFNYFHPMGFAYFADGAHDDKDELEPGITPPGSNNTCATSLSCPAPMYFVNGTYQGTYSNIPMIRNKTTEEDNFGLDDYEPRFFWPFREWLEQGDDPERFSIYLRFTDKNYTGDIFYFCHIHQYMTGRIKLLHGGKPVQTENLPEIPYEYDVPSQFDTGCGTLGIGEFQLPHSECPDRFICGKASSAGLAKYTECNDAMNCKMIADMTTGVSAESEIALFMHQMIPHHENAINMAKALLNSGKLDGCTDYLSEDPICAMFDIIISIVNGQNFQVQAMRGLLDDMGYLPVDDCVVSIARAN